MTLPWSCDGTGSLFFFFCESFTYSTVLDVRAVLHSGIVGGTIRPPSESKPQRLALLVKPAAVYGIRRSPISTSAFSRAAALRTLPAEPAYLAGWLPGLPG